MAGFEDEEGGAQSPAVTLGTVRIEQRRASFERGAPAVSLATPAQFGTHARLYGYGYEPDGDGARAVSYTHLDVYKRQPQDDPLLTGPTPRLLSDGAVTWSPAVQASVDAALAAGALWFPEPLTFGSTLPAEIEAYLEENASNLENRWYGATRLTAWADLPTPEALSLIHI